MAADLTGRGDPDAQALWGLYRQVHDAGRPQEEALAAVDAWLRRRLLEDWVREARDLLTELGVRVVTAELGSGEAIALEVDAAD